MNSVAIVVVVSCLAFLSGCSNDFSGNTYEARGVGEVSRAEQGVVVSVRRIKIKQDPSSNKTGALLGGAGGALVGSMFGSGHGKLLGAGVGAVAGAVAGDAIQNRMIDGFEYTIRLLNGSVVTVTQGVEPSIPPGSEVYVVCSEKGRSRVIPK